MTAIELKMSLLQEVMSLEDEQLIKKALDSVRRMKMKVSEKAAFFFCYAARLLSIFIFKISLVFSIITFREVILQK